MEDVDLCSINYLHFGAPKVHPAPPACLTMVPFFAFLTNVCYMARKNNPGAAIISPWKEGVLGWKVMLHLDVSVDQV